MLSLRRILAAAALLALGGCGFTPLYGDSGGDQPGVAQRLDEVDVQNIPERPGQMLRDQLEDQLHAAGAPSTELYTLAVSFSVNEQNSGVQADSSVTYNRFVATAGWTLAPIGAPSATLAKGTASTEDQINVINQQYFALTLEQNTVNQQIADELAQQIDTQVAAYFRTHPGS